MTDQQNEKLEDALNRIEQLRHFLNRLTTQTSSLIEEAQKAQEDYYANQLTSDSGIKYGRIDDINQIALKMQSGAAESLINIIKKELED